MWRGINDNETLASAWTKTLVSDRTAGTMATNTMRGLAGCAASTRSKKWLYGDATNAVYADCKRV